MTTTRLFRSTDSGAPTLTGETGSLINLLHTCLVGSAGVAYGTGGNEKTAAGWSEPFTNTATKGVWRNSLAVGGLGMYYRVLDDGSGTGGAREAFTRSYASMSDMDTGDNPAPAPSQISLGITVRKSSALNSSPSDWIIVADERTFYCVRSGTAAYEDILFGAGDFDSEVHADAFAYFNMGKTGQNSSYLKATWLRSNLYYRDALISEAGLYAGTGYSLSGDPVALSSLIVGIQGIMGTVGMANPAPGSSKNYFAPLLVVSQNMIRGRLRGLYQPLNDRTATPNGTMEVGTVGLPVGAAIMVIKCYSYATEARVGIETELPW